MGTLANLLWSYAALPSALSWKLGLQMYSAVYKSPSAMYTFPLNMACKEGDGEDCIV